MGLRVVQGGRARLSRVALLTALGKSTGHFGAALGSPLDREANARSRLASMEKLRGGQAEGTKAERDAHCPILSETGPGRSQGGGLGLGVRVTGRVLSTWRRTQRPPEAREGSLRTGPTSPTSLPLLAGSLLSGSGLGAEAARLASRRASDKTGLVVP